MLKLNYFPLQILWLTLILFTSQPSAAANNDLSSELRFFQEGYSASGFAAIAGRKLKSPEILAAFYSENKHTPIWIGGKRELNRFSELLTEIESSSSHGFNPEYYNFNILSDPKQPALVREILATDAFLTQVRNRTAGVVSPHQIEPEWLLTVDEVDAKAVLELALNENDVAGNLQLLWPTQSEYWLLVEKRKSLLQENDHETILVPEGFALKKGQIGERVLRLKQRLFGPGDYTSEFDNELEKVVKDFQFSSGLEPDGIVGAATLEILNASHFSWIDRIDANLERWRWLPHHLPTTYIRVNIAAFHLRAIKDSTDQLKINVIVGRFLRKTPIFTADMKYLVINPYWNVPYKLATEDKLPLLKKNPKELDLLGFEVKAADSDTFLPVSMIDWTNIYPRNFNYLLRQKPGPKNALGTIKFMLPNLHSVYLHDTPDHSLFAKQERSFSSGCIRLSEPILLAEWILNNDNQPQIVDELKRKLTTSETKSFNLKKPLPVLIVYFTAFKGEDQTIVFRRDIYNRDQRIINALKVDK